MPKCDGYEATKQIRQLDDPIKRKIRIVALTASAIVGDRERCITSGMDSYLSSAPPFSVALFRLTNYRFL